MKNSRKIIIAIGNLVIFAALAVWMYKNISFGEIVSHARSIPASPLLTALALNIAVLFIYGARLSALLGCRFRPAFATVLLGFGLNGILPVRLGEVAKIIYARQLFGISTSRLAAATVAEKLMDLGAIVLLGFAVTQVIPFPAIRSSMSVLALLLIGAAISLMGVFWLRRRWLHFEKRLYAWFAHAIDVLRGQMNAQQAFVIGFYTLTIWAITVLSVYAMFAGMYEGFRVADAFLLTLVLVLAIAIPSAPAGLGIVEAGIVGYLHQVVGVDVAHAIAAALAFHFVIVAPQILSAVSILAWGMLRHRLPLAEMSIPKTRSPD